VDADSVVRAHPAKGGSEDHPAPFSVQFAAELAEPYAEVGEMVLDPFLGSGTTLIACEQLGRVCYGIEIEPRYVDVAVLRWCKATGRRAVLESTGEPFPIPPASEAS
jgi:DNA modification methylase